MFLDEHEVQLIFVSILGFHILEKNKKYEQSQHVMIISHLCMKRRKDNNFLKYEIRN